MTKFTNNIDAWLAKTLEQLDLRAQRMTGDILRLGKQNVPYRDGVLYNSGEIIKRGWGKYDVVFGRKAAQEYALIQEKKQFQNYTVAGTGPHYLEDSGNTIGRQSISYFKGAR